MVYYNYSSGSSQGSDKVCQNSLPVFDEDKGWKYSNSRIYHVSTEKMTWDEGRKACKEKEADLVIINSREEQILVTGLTKNQNAWIGLTDGDSEGVWKWVDDSALTTGFWRSGEPNSYAGDEDCVVTGYGSDPVNNWADYPCSDRFIWVCERPFDSGYQPPKGDT
ncbi:C-type lectin domain family 4 member E-like [Colossoma macropomum]|uniref:C-type lectin domain family 4 member E-like n=1 Tax=Colossoma macropomum TaxID=42526 RepID=UPI00186536AD|nr:C-type lectin domain family 4 member E-like [Colossoma macropomum]